MKAGEAKAGEKYISRTGVPVTVIEATGAKTKLKLETTGSSIWVNNDYELKPRGAEVQRKGRNFPKGKTGAVAGTGPQKSLTLSAIIDPMLFDGGHTVSEIAGELSRKAGESAKGKDLEANIRARLVSYKRKGWKIVKNGKQIQILPGEDKSLH